MAGEKGCAVLLAGLILFQIYSSLVGGRQACVTRISGGWLLKVRPCWKACCSQLWSKAKVRIEKEELGDSYGQSYLELIAGLTAVFGQPACQTY